MALTSHKHECNGACAPWSTHTRALQEGSRGEAARKGGVQRGGGHDSTQNACGAHVPRSPEPLVHLKRQDGRRLLPIAMVVMLAFQHKVERGNAWAGMGP